MGRVELDHLPGGPVGVPVPLPAPQDLLDEGDGRRTAQADVEEPGAGDDDVADAVRTGEMRPEDLCDASRGLPGGPGELEGDAGGVVTTAAGPAARSRRPAQARPR